MPDFPQLPIITTPGRPFPQLPVVTPAPPRLTLQEKYGGLYYLGIAGLVFSIGLVGKFAYDIWVTRDFWTAIATLHDEKRSEPERIRAAWAVARHPTANDRQRFDIAVRKDLPRLARYVIAEGLTSEAIRADPKGYALMVARSEGWPDWLRLLMARPMAYGVGEGYRIAWEPLDLLREHKDPAIALWATYTRAAMPPGDSPAARALEAATAGPGPFQPLAALLDAAAKADGQIRLKKLDEATAWVRTHHPEALEVWSGWAEKDGQLIGPATGSPSAGPG